MATERAIVMALDLARMPAFAPSMSASPLPADVLEVIRIAAESTEACRAAALATGASERVLVDAARFYLQQVLFREDADCYRVLGIRPDQPRASAREHMRWLLRWLHPDRNGSWDAVYAKRVVDAWREVSKKSQTTGDVRPATVMTERQGRFNPSAGRGRRPSQVRIPWIARPYEQVSKRRRKTFAARAKKIAIGLVAILLLLGLTALASPLRTIDLW